MNTVITINPGEVKALPLSLIKQDPNNIRKTFNPESLQELADDIKLRGVLEPIVVTANGKGYIIKLGERRFRASQLAKMETIPCILSEDAKTDDAGLKRLIDQYAENFQREDLNPMDLAVFFRTCIDQHKIKVVELSEKLQTYGIKKTYDRTTISNLLRLLELPDWAKDYIRAGQLTQRHGRALLPGLASAKVMKRIQGELIKYFKQSQEERELNPLTTAEFQASINQAFRQEHPTTDGYGKSVAEYDVSKLDKETKEKLNILELDDGEGDKDGFILNETLHKELEKKAKAGEIAPHPYSDTARKRRFDKEFQDENKKTAAKTAGQEQKAPVNTEASAERLQRWLHRFLLKWIDKKVAALPAKDRTDLFDKLLQWFAQGAPHKGYSSSVFHHDVADMQDHLIDSNDNRIINGLHKDTGIKSLTEALRTKTTVRPFTDVLVTKSLHCIDLREAGELAVHLKFNIDKDIIIDADFAAMYTGAGIEKIIKKVKLKTADHSKNWLNKPDTMKTGDKRKYMVKISEYIGTPDPVAAAFKKHCGR